MVGYVRTNTVRVPKEARGVPCENGGMSATRSEGTNHPPAPDLRSVMLQESQGQDPHDAVEITTDPNRIDLDRVHAWLCASYWAKGISRDVVARSIRGSLCFSAWRPSAAGNVGGVQVGFARVITDRATFAYVCDVIVDAPERGRGVGTALMDAIMRHEDLRGLRRVCLLTRDAHGLYASFGFNVSPSIADRYMEKHDPHVYSERPS